MLMILIIFCPVVRSYYTQCQAGEKDWLQENASLIPGLQKTIEDWLSTNSFGNLLLEAELNHVRTMAKVMRVDIPELVIFAQAEVYYLRAFARKNFGPQMIRPCVETPQVVIIFLERLLGDLQQAQLIFIRQPPATKLNLLLHIGEAIEYLHSHGIVHGDLKLENIALIHREGVDIKLLDFEKSGRAGSRPYTGTSVYAPPEHFNTKRRLRLDTAQDRWSYALLSSFIFSPAFMNKYASVFMNEIQEGDFERRHLQRLVRMMRKEFGSELERFANLFASWFGFSPYQRPLIKEMLSELRSALN